MTPYLITNDVIKHLVSVMLKGEVVLCIRVKISRETSRNIVMEA